MLIRNTNNADFINTFFVFIIQSLHQIKYAFECVTNTKKIVSLKMKSVVMVSCMYIHLYSLWGQHLGRMPLLNTICVEVCKNRYIRLLMPWNLVDINTSQNHLKSSITVIISKCFHEDGICLESYKMIINYLKRCWYSCFTDI